MKADTVRKYLKPFRIQSRWTTFNGSFQAALAVPEEYDRARHAEALRLLAQEPDVELECVYCGAPAATWDHLENNVKGGRFSGFGHRIFNLVPACRTCNEKKGGTNWRTFLSKRAPADQERRETVLAAFAARNAAESFGWEQIRGEFPELATEFDSLLSEVRERLVAADAVALKIRQGIEARLRANGVPAPLHGQDDGARREDIGVRPKLP